MLTDTDCGHYSKLRTKASNNKECGVCSMAYAYFRLVLQMPQPANPANARVLPNLGFEKEPRDSSNEAHRKGLQVISSLLRSLRS